MNNQPEHYEISEIIFTQTGPGERAVIQMDKLGDLLDSKGGIKDIKSTVSFVNQMKDACKLPCRFIFLYVIEATNEEVLTDFMKNGGWSVVSHWLQDAKTKDNKALINCLLNICKILPVSVEQMKENNCAKLIKSISKTDNSDLKNLAKSIVEKWKNAVKNEGNQTDKKKKKHKHRKKSLEEIKSEESPPSKMMKTSPKLGEVETNNKTLRTVKEPKLKLRATGLEQETNLPQKKKGSKDNHVTLPKISTTLPPSKRASMAAKNIQPPEKKAKKETGDVQQGKIKLITTPPPMPAQESSLFMDAIMTTSKNAPKRKKVKKTQKSSTSPSHTASSPPYSTENCSSPPATQDLDEKSEKTEKDDGSPGPGGYAPKLSKKRVRWAEESNLKTFHYFELDETERVNVNKLKDFEEVKREEMMREKQAILAKKAGFDLDDGLTVTHFWNPLMPIGTEDLPNFPKGTKSNEVMVQREREEHVLAAIYFNKSAIPPSPHEPDFHPETKCPPPVNIPLHSGNEMRFEHQAHRSSESGMLQTSDGKLQLRPDVSNLLASMANQVQNGGQMQVAKDAIQKLPSRLRSLLEQPHIQGVVVQTVGDDPKKIMELLNDPNKLEQIIGDYQVRQIRGNGSIGGGVNMSSGVRMGGGVRMGVNMGGGRMGGGGGGGGSGGGADMPQRYGHAGGGNGQFRASRRIVCKHYRNGTCKYGPDCNFLHPGINGPRV